MYFVVCKLIPHYYVAGDKPVYVQSVKEHGAAWRAGLRSGDRILCVDAVPVLEHTHQQVVHMIRGGYLWCFVCGAGLLTDDIKTRYKH